MGVLESIRGRNSAEGSRSGAEECVSRELSCSCVSLTFGTVKDEMQIDFALRYVEALSKYEHFAMQRPNSPRIVTPTLISRRSLNVEERLSRQVEELLTDLLVVRHFSSLFFFFHC